MGYASRASQPLHASSMHRQKLLEQPRSISILSRRQHDSSNIKQFPNLDTANATIWLPPRSDPCSAALCPCNVSDAATVFFQLHATAAVSEPNDAVAESAIAN
ncbi:uncharacterized protein HMPREF1541_05279 [Cyphellophora europaea CBS 101466]|uniref:Uncharacterized protein n=1 Tax=Cyphellophora europaea (strain CBS 101466) TaxID=1220924 RepID=W2RRG8_CYPE1|nr:uncharacterized protein HMPREF1541_05279 [Cyphellophora europaea CBS 101466]ETN39057.1 hypothetical protein HMPREF1541_05279 [Cyphellophora europaea CBS 101466]